MMEDSNKNKSDEEEEKKDSTVSSTRKFLKKLDFSQIKPEKDKKESEGEKNEESKHDSHALPTAEDFLRLLKVKDIKSGKKKLRIIIGIVAGSLLILTSIFLMMAPTENVADNVIFNEKAVFSVFLILIGILIISGVLAQKFLDKSFFKGVNREFDSDKGVPSNQDEKNIKKDNINRNNR